MSYTLKYTGAEIDDILDRAVEGGAIDEELALKAPLESPALTGTPTAPTPAESDNSTKVATTAYADRAAAGAAAAAYPVDTASGSVASFADGADAIPMKSFVASIEPIQEGSGDPSPSNIRAISGHSGVNAVVAGVNVLPTQGGRTNNDVTFTRNADGSVSLSGTASANAFMLGGSAPKLRVKAGTYYLSGGYSTRITVYVAGYYADGTSFSSTRAGTSEVEITLEQDADLYLNVYVQSGTNATGAVVYPMLSPQSGQTYEKYNGTVYPVTFYDGDDPLTVYKGSVDLVSGVLTVTHGRLDLGSKSWTATNGAFYTAAPSDAYNPVNAGVVPDMLCDSYAVAETVRNSAGITALPNNSVTLYTVEEYFRIIVKNTAYSDPADLKVALDGVYLVYQLDTPQPYQLTPTQVLSLLGQNNCYNDCGNTAVEYRADIALYVQKLLGGNVNTLSMSAPTPSLSLGRTGVLLEPDALEPVITEDAEPDLAEEETEEPEAEEE